MAGSHPPAVCFCGAGGVEWHVAQYNSGRIFFDDKAGSMFFKSGQADACIGSLFEDLFPAMKKEHHLRIDESIDVVFVTTLLICSQRVLLQDENHFQLNSCCKGKVNAVVLLMTKSCPRKELGWLKGCCSLCDICNINRSKNNWSYHPLIVGLYF